MAERRPPAWAPPGVLVRVFEARDCPPALPAADLVIDAAYGTGFKRTWSAPDIGGAPVLAVDLPSGIDGLTGEARGRPLAASRTVTFAAFEARARPRRWGDDGRDRRRRRHRSRHERGLRPPRRTGGRRVVAAVAGTGRAQVVGRGADGRRFGGDDRRRPPRRRRRRSAPAAGWSRCPRRASMPIRRSRWCSTRCPRPGGRRSCSTGSTASTPWSSAQGWGARRRRWRLCASSSPPPSCPCWSTATGCTPCRGRTPALRRCCAVGGTPPCSRHTTASTAC